MTASPPPSESPCAADCTRCGAGEGRSCDAEPAEAVLRGGQLVLASLGTFVLPLVLAVGGAWAAGPAASGQVAGAIGGLLVGAGTGAILLRTPLCRGSTGESDGAPPGGVRGERSDSGCPPKR